MIIDAHCHAWSYYPYQPPVPDPESRATVAQLLYEMEQNGVDQALIVSAEIDHNPDNNAYTAAQVNAHPGNLHQAADIDSMWKPTYHTPGAAQRLKVAAVQWTLKGFTHYLHADDAGDWLYSADGLALFEAAQSLNLFASIHCHPHQQAAIRQVARAFPNMPILIHHLGHPHAGHSAEIDAILKSAECPNIYIKTSAFYYCTAGAQWDYPFADVQPIVRAIYGHYGAQRMCWGSDFPVVARYMTHRQALEKFRTHCAFIPPDDQAWILGGTMHRILHGA